MATRQKARRRSGVSPTRLTPSQQIFVTAYLRNGFNARRAYHEAHPQATIQTAQVEGIRTLNLPKVRRWLARRVDAAWKRRQMDAEQALARVAGIAAFDVRDLFDAEGNLLNPRAWPESVVGVIRGFQETDKGLRVQLESAHTALRTLLELAGKLRTPGESLDALAQALKADLAAHGRTGAERD